MTDIAVEIKSLIIETLDLEDIEIEDIETDAPLFVDGLGLDSIDALEIGVALQKHFGVTIDGNAEETREQFYSVATLSKLIAEGSAK